MRRDNSNNPLQVRMRVKSLPKSVRPKQFYRRLIQFIDDGKPIPPRWDVELWWRNPKTRYGMTKRWRSDDFEGAISDSRAGFVSLIRNVLVRRLRSVP